MNKILFISIFFLLPVFIITCTACSSGNSSSVVVCDSNNDCNIDQYCDVAPGTSNAQGICVTTSPCVNMSDCPNSFRCIDGFCKPPTAEINDNNPTDDDIQEPDQNTAVDTDISMPDNDSNVNPTDSDQNYIDYESNDFSTDETPDIDDTGNTGDTGNTADSGNSADSGNTTTPVCGNGIIDGTEDCDDGNNGNDSDGCTDSCSFSCVDNSDCLPQDEPGDCQKTLCKAGGFGQKCTPANDVDDVPSADNPCVVGSCTELGGTLLPVEDNTSDGTACDNGHNEEADYCIDGNCEEAVCGDDIEGPMETCDDGNDDPCDGCLNNCTAYENICGDGIVCGEEICDDGVNNTDSWELLPHCNTDCTGQAPYCGDNTLQSPDETCDDGNSTDDSNGCSEACKQNNDCGNGTTETLFESCDGQTAVPCGDIGHFVGGTADCTPTCSWDKSSCISGCIGDSPDGTVASEEACDDGNESNNDGCTALCQIESGSDCAFSPSECVTGSIIFSDDFENGTASWIIPTANPENEWEIGSPNIAGYLTEAYSGNNVMGTDLDGFVLPDHTDWESGVGYFSDCIAGTDISIVLPKNCSSATLRMHVWTDNKKSYTEHYYDGVSVLVNTLSVPLSSPDNLIHDIRKGNDAYESGICGASENNNYSTTTADLSELCTDEPVSLVLSFVYFSDIAESDEYAGTFIDNIMLYSE